MTESGLNLLAINSPMRPHGTHESQMELFSLATTNLSKVPANLMGMRHILINCGRNSDKIHTILNSLKRNLSICHTLGILKTVLSKKKNIAFYIFQITFSYSHLFVCKRNLLGYNIMDSYIHIYKDQNIK